VSSAGAALARILQAGDAKLQYERERLVMLASADGRGGATQPGVRHWIRYCIFGRQISPVRVVDEQSPRAAKLDEETLLMDFVLWLVRADVHA
jgi:hypothetical protein